MFNFNTPISPQFISIRIKLGRKVRGLTQTTLSELSGLTQTQISRLEKALSQSLDINDIHKIASVFSLSLTEFLEPDLTIFQKSLENNAPETPEDQRFIEWTMQNIELQTELENWISQDKTITFETKELMNSFLAIPSMKKAAILSTSKDIQEELTPSQHLIIVDNNFDAKTVNFWEAYSEVFIPELFKQKTKALLSVASIQEWEFLSQEWKELTEQGWLHITKDDQENLCIHQLMHTNNANNLVVIPLWEKNKKWFRKNMLLGNNTENFDIPSNLIIDNPYQPEKDSIPYGVNTKGKPFAINIDNFKSHAYICGTTGSGKSTALEWWGYGLAKSGKSLVFMTPHPEHIDNLMAGITIHAPERSKDIVLVDFNHPNTPISFNPLDVDNFEGIESSAKIVKEMMLKLLNISSDAIPRAINYLEQSIYAMSEYNFKTKPSNKLNLSQVVDFFTDKEFRQLVVEHCSNISIQKTFSPDGPFETLGERIQLDHVMPIVRTVSALNTKVAFADIFNQSQNKIDFANWVNQNKIVLIKLPSIPSDAALSIATASLIAPSIKASVPNWNKDASTYFIVDEFQNYHSRSYIDIIKQGGKQGLYLIAANQSPQHLNPDLLDAIQSNVEHKAIMRLNQDSANTILPYIQKGKEYPKVQDITNLPNFTGWTNCVNKDGSSTEPLKFKTLTPLAIIQLNDTELMPLYSQSDVYGQKQDLVERKNKIMEDLSK